MSRFLCQCYKNVQHKDLPCSNKAEKGKIYCGVHRNCQFIFVKPEPAPVPVDVDVVVAEPIKVTTRDPDLAHMTKRCTFHHLQFDWILSGLQKAIRRGLLNEAYAYAIEGDLYSLIEPNSQAKGNRTNLVNRLRIILVEDLFHWPTVLLVEPWFTQWEKNRHLPIGRQYLLQIVQALVMAPKIRLLSDFKMFLSPTGGTSSPLEDLFAGWDSVIDSDPLVKLINSPKILMIKRKKMMFPYQQVNLLLMN